MITSWPRTIAPMVAPFGSLISSTRRPTTLLPRAPCAIAYALEAVNRGSDAGFAEGSRLEASLFGILFATEDMKEGTRAFLEKRPPVWKGR